MSCWRTYACNKIKNASKDLLDKTLKDNGYDINWDKHRINVPGYDRGQRINGILASDYHVDGVICRDGEELTLGVVLNNQDKELEIIGDYYMTGIDSTEFQQMVTQHYLKNQIIERTSMMGYALDNIAFAENGDIELEVYSSF